MRIFRYGQGREQGSVSRGHRRQIRVIGDKWRSMHTICDGHSALLPSVTSFSAAIDVKSAWNDPVTHSPTLPDAPRRRNPTRSV